MKTTRVFFALALAAALVGCGESPDETAAKAKQFVEQEKPDEAAKLYRQIVEEWPQSPEAPLALYELAQLHSNNLIEAKNKRENLERAVEYYERLHADYPNHEKAPLALFSVGFIQNNELQDYDAATRSYNKFIEEYPNHELVASAKDELEFMGMSPEDILKQKAGVE
jgi:TolA-binding protein